MKIHYRIRKDQIEIVRCFGADPQIVLPEQIGGLAVTQTAAYAFSDRKETEEEDVLVFETEEHRMFRDEEILLAGEAVESVAFPDTMQKIGRYVFYGCRNLKELSFSDQLEDIGSGAFTGCRSLNRLEVNLTKGDRTCVKEILGDLWQRIDVTLRKGEEEARLVFPEHYEEAVRTRRRGSSLLSITDRETTTASASIIKRPISGNMTRCFSWQRHRIRQRC